MKTDFLAYFLKMCRKKDQKWRIVYQHFYNHAQGHCTFGDVTIEFCQGFRENLLNAKQLKRKGKVSVNSAAGY